MMGSEKSIAVVNADVRTMDEAGTRAEALIIIDGVIERVGSSAEITDLASREGIEVRDLGGRSVLPGFIDAHTHLELASYSLSEWPEAHTPPCSSLSEVAEVITRFLEERPGDDLIIVRSSFGMHTKVAEGRLFSRAELDALTSERPIMVAAGLHVMSINTPAMELLGILDLQDSPERIIHRDALGVPNGIVTEVLDLLPALPQEKVEAALRAHIPVLATRNGVTTVGSIALNPEDDQTMSRLIEDGVPLRLRSYAHVPRTATLSQMIQSGVQSSDAIERAGVGGIKIFIDGQHGDGLDAVFDDPKWAPDALNQFVRDADRAGLQVIMHAVSTMAIRMAFDALEGLDEIGANRRRHRIEHGGDYIEVEDLARAKRLDVILITTPQFIQSTQGESGGPEAPLKSILKAGVRLAGGTDTTGTVPQGAAPLYNMACAIDRPLGDGSIVDERLTFDEAAALFTSAAAYSLFEEQNRGRLVAGSLGDVVVLNQAVDSVDDYFTLEVDVTVFEGRVVFERGSE